MHGRLPTRFDASAWSARLLQDLAPYRSGQAVDEPIWTPLPGPQVAAYESEADELFYGGAAGGGKTDLLLGLAMTQHRVSVVFRRTYPQLRAVIERSREIVGTRGTFNSAAGCWRLHDGRRVELGAVQHEQDKTRFQGRPHDLITFDELPHFTQSQYRFLTGWARTTTPGQRVRVVAAGNPPTPGQGDWVIGEWAPWLDRTYPRPAEPGELRWYAVLDGRVEWVEGPGEIRHTRRDGSVEVIQPRSRTFIPARVSDNPFLMSTGYTATLQALPEPLRSQLLYGDFGAAAEDDPWQVIPTAWVLQAMERSGQGERPKGPLSCVGVDVARGGADQTVLARRYGAWFGPLEKHVGAATPDGPAVAALVQRALQQEPPEDPPGAVN
ncbi:MAG: terminase, partial [Armatimonadetes bacterium]|nr:terminase [Armatimonadota bacterium]